MSTPSNKPDIYVMATTMRALQAENARLKRQAELLTQQIDVLTNLCWQKVREDCYEVFVGYKGSVRFGVARSEEEAKTLVRTGAGLPKVSPN